jgi:flagellar FliL protein
MPTNPMELSRGGREEPKAPEGDKEADAKADAPAKSASALKAWLPLLVGVLTMPVLAYATTQFVILPRLQHALNAPKATPSAEAADPTVTGKDGEKVPGGKPKVTVALSKMLVNVSGTMGTRYLMTSVTLVGNTPDFKSKIEDNKDQLMDLATGTLSSKTISDLEKPGARNVIRSELMTVFNNALGNSLVQEIYITEMAIQ